MQRQELLEMQVIHKSTQIYYGASQDDSSLLLFEQHPLWQCVAG